MNWSFLGKETSPLYTALIQISSKLSFLVEIKFVLLASTNFLYTDKS